MLIHRVLQSLARLADALAIFSTLFAIRQAKDTASDDKESGNPRCVIRRIERRLEPPRRGRHCEAVPPRQPL